ncbi:alpha-2-macroglobulin [Alphaproteobacteria bacterium]
MVGQQKFEKKGASPGGDGANGTAGSGNKLSLRDVPKFVSYWNPSIKLDKGNNAEVEFEAPDNLTGWRVIMLAANKSDKFGAGEATFKVNRATEIRPVMPNQVTEGDDFEAGFNIMNRTDRERVLEVVIEAKGNVNEQQISTATQNIKLAPYERTTVLMPLHVGLREVQKVADDSIVFNVYAKDNEDSGTIKHILKVERAVSIDVAANYNSTVSDKVEESLAIPEGVLLGLSKVSVSLSPSIIGNFAEVFEYARDYPYACFEQKLTKAIMAAYYTGLNKYLPSTLIWQNSESILLDTLKYVSTFQAPNGGMVYYVAKEEYVDPYLSAYTALMFNKLRELGYNVEQSVEINLHRYLEDLLKHDVKGDFYSDDMSYTVRAVALAALSEHNKITFADIDRYYKYVTQMSLFGKAHYLQAALNAKKTHDTKELISIIVDVTNQILSYGNQSSGKMSFTEDLDSGYFRILHSRMRDDCAILSAFVKLKGESLPPEVKDIIGDIPVKLANTIIQGMKGKAHLWNTQESAFCTNALLDYSKIYENEAPNMQIDVNLDGKSFGSAKFQGFKDLPVVFEQGLQVADMGKKVKINIEKNGNGRAYYATNLYLASRKVYDTSTNAGMDITREYSVKRDGKWQLLTTSPFLANPGDLVRVDIYLSVPSARYFVVVDDPVPGGLEPVDTNLATASMLDADAAAGGDKIEGSIRSKFDNWVEYGEWYSGFYHKELRHNSARFYSEYLTLGNYHLSYAAQVVAPGTFLIMPVYTTAMYDPDIYGRGISAHLKVVNKKNP